MTTGATILRTRAACHVLRVIEFDVKAFFERVGKSFARRIVAVHRTVTDRAHRNVRRRELRQMTAGAIFVSGKTRPGGIVRSMMAARAAECSVL